MKKTHTHREYYGLCRTLREIKEPLCRLFGQNELKVLRKIGDFGNSLHMYGYSIIGTHDS